MFIATRLVVAVNVTETRLIVLTFKRCGMFVISVTLVINTSVKENLDEFFNEVPPSKLRGILRCSYETMKSRESVKVYATFNPFLGLDPTLCVVD